MNWVEVDGVLYKKPCVLVTSMGLDHPNFAKLIHIFVLDSKKVIFQVQPLQTIEFNPHFHCFTVKQSPIEPYVFTFVQSLFSYLPHHLRVLPASFGNLCVVSGHFFVNSS